MKTSFKKILKTICLSVVLFLPMATHAAPTGEIIFRHPVDFYELWLGNGDDERSARRIFRLPRPINTFSIQKEGHYIVTVAEERLVDNRLPDLIDVYLLDRKKPGAEAKNLTRGEYTQIPDAAISRNGDIVFINLSFIIPKNGKFIRGLYLIPFREIEKKRPKAELLLEVDAEQVDWAPNGKEIVYETDWGIFHFDIRTKKISHITKDGTSPVFSPDGKKIAFLTTTRPTKIGIKTVGQHNIQYIELKEGTDVVYLTWSTDGKYLVYSSYIDRIPIFDYFNFAVHIESGVIERVLETYSNGGLQRFEWVTKAYALEPEGLLTTVWGKIKQKK